MTGAVSVYISAGSREEAEKIAHIVVKERLAACASFIPGMWSIYRWKDKIEETEECALILKCTEGSYPVLEKWIKEIHSYECPCIVAWPIKNGNADFIDWIRSNCFA